MTPGRDPFIDGVRSVAIVRVLLLHTFLWVELPWVGTFSYFMPGMPLVFFISGALAAQSLRANGWSERVRFWRDRARRLFLPFWTFAALAVVACLVADALFTDTAYDYAWERAWCWILPLAGPRASPALDRLVWHLWFLSSLILMLGAAPLTVALHRRRPWSGALAFAISAVALELSGFEVPGVVRNTLLFGAAFQLGYGYSDGSFARLHRGVLLAGGISLALFALAWHAHVAPGTMVHAVPLAHVALGLAFVAFWLSMRSPAASFFERPWFVRLRQRVNPRAYTIFLWGPVANEIASRTVASLETWRLPAYLALSFALIVGAMTAFGPVEDLAARRRSVTRTLERKVVEELRKAA